jgi:hypothetical protein
MMIKQNINNYRGHFHPRDGPHQEARFKDRVVQPINSDIKL